MKKSLVIALACASAYASPNLRKTRPPGMVGDKAVTLDLFHSIFKDYSALLKNTNKLAVRNAELNKIVALTNARELVHKTPPVKLTAAHMKFLKSSCVGVNSCGIGAPLLFGATAITDTDVEKNWLADSDSTVTHAMTGSDQGMFNGYAAISAYWSDTTAMDNLRGADITSSTVAGSLETIAAQSTANNVRGGHSVHTASSSTFNA